MKKKIWTATSVDDEPGTRIDHNVCGSYTTYDGAVDACVDYIIDRIKVRDDIRYALMNDVNHVVDKFIETSGMWGNELMDLFDYWGYCEKDRDFSMSEKVESALRDYLKDAVRAESGYVIETDFDSKIGASTYIFAIHESVLEED